MKIRKALVELRNPRQKTASSSAGAMVAENSPDDIEESATDDSLVVRIGREHADEDGVNEADILLGNQKGNKSREGNRNYHKAVQKFRSKLSPTKGNRAEVVDITTLAVDDGVARHL